MTSSIEWVGNIGIIYNRRTFMDLRTKEVKIFKNEAEARNYLLNTIDWTKFKETALKWLGKKGNQRKETRRE